MTDQRKKAEEVILSSGDLKNFFMDLFRPCSVSPNIPAFVCISTTPPGKVSSLTQVTWQDVRNEQGIVALVAAAERAIADGEQVYFTILPRYADLGIRRGKSTETSMMTAFFTDVDFGKPRTPPDAETAMDFILSAFPLPPSMIVSTGHGYQCYWLLEEPVMQSADCGLLDELIGRFGQATKIIAAKCGWEFDPVHEASRSFRVPGSRNTKCPDNPIEIALVR